MTEVFRDLPSVDRLLAEDKIQRLISTNSRRSVLSLIRDELSGIRDTLKRGGLPPNLDELIQQIEDQKMKIRYHTNQKINKLTEVSY